MKDERLLPGIEEAVRECPSDLLYFEDPQDDNQRLLNYQHDWLKHGDAEAWKNLWELSQVVARRMIRAQERKRGFVLCHATRQDRVETAVEYVLRRYRNGWYVRKAFLKAIKEGVIHALWYRTKADENETVCPDEILNAMTVAGPGEEENQLVLIEGMTTEEAVAKIRAELLPEIAEELLKKVKIIGGKNEQRF